MNSVYIKAKPAGWNTKRVKNVLTRRVFRPLLNPYVDEEVICPCKWFGYDPEQHVFHMMAVGDLPVSKRSARDL